MLVGLGNHGISAVLAMVLRQAWDHGASPGGSTGTGGTHVPQRSYDNERFDQPLVSAVCFEVDEFAG